MLREIVMSNKEAATAIRTAVTLMSRDAPRLCILVARAKERGLITEEEESAYERVCHSIINDWAYASSFIAHEFSSPMRALKDWPEDKAIPVLKAFWIAAAEGLERDGWSFEELRAYALDKTKEVWYG